MRKNFKASEESASQKAKSRFQPVRLRPRNATLAVVSAAGDGHHHVDIFDDGLSVRQAYTSRSRRSVARPGGTRPPVGGVTKRLFDVLAAAVGLVVLAPLLLLIGLAVKLDSAGPAIFKQERGGLGGRTFRIWKFRTMSVTENRGVVQARRGDARVTRLGAFLRRSSWDELPQLVNVLIGDMSIIGPRPHALEHDDLFERVDARYSVRRRARPGVTGLAQVNGCRGPTETDDKIRARTGFDAEYVQHWSLWGDVLILAATVAVLFWKRDPGAL